MNVQKTKENMCKCGDFDETRHKDRRKTFVNVEILMRLDAAKGILATMKYDCFMHACGQ